MKRTLFFIYLAAGAVQVIPPALSDKHWLQTVTSLCFGIAAGINLAGWIGGDR